jgi:hypothetical protein
MSSRLLPEEFVMRHDSRDDGRAIGTGGAIEPGRGIGPGRAIEPGRGIGPGRAIEPPSLWKRRWVLAIVVLAAILGFCALLSSVLRAYGESDYDYLTGVPTLSPPAGLA